MWRKVLGIGAVVLLVGALVGGGAYIVLRDDGGQGSGRQEGHGGGGLGGWGNISGAGLAWGNGGNGSRGRAGADGGILGGGGGAGRSGASLLSGGGAGRAGRTSGNGGGNWNDPGVLGNPGSEEKARGRRAGVERAIADDARTRQVITATVLAADADLVVQVADGTTLTVGIGPARYRDARGVPLLPGDTVRLVGFENDDGTFVPGEIENLSRGGVLILRDASGRPLWSGRGRRGS